MQRAKRKTWHTEIKHVKSMKFMEKKDKAQRALDQHDAQTIAGIK
jgi:hypothetical protein